jgi:hypothetical protein
VRCSLLFSAVLLALGFAGCADVSDHAARPPKIEGRVKSVSSTDISKVTVLIQQDMIKHFGRVTAIERFDVVDHNHIWVFYWYGATERMIEFQRIHGLWSFPTGEAVVVSG